MRRTTLVVHPSSSTNQSVSSVGCMPVWWIYIHPWQLQFPALLLLIATDTRDVVFPELNDDIVEV